MVSRVSKLPYEAIDQIGDSGFRTSMFVEDWIPQHTDIAEAIGLLRDEASSWSVLTVNQPLALFKLDLHDKQVSLERFCPIKESSASLQEVISALRNDLDKMGTTEIKIKVRRRS
jgi:hypothetical protein